MPPRDAAPDGTDAARERLAAAQHALLAALTAGAPDPAGFDPDRLRVQRQVLAAKRAGVIATIEPGIPAALGGDYRRLALAHARSRPLTGGYRDDAVAFVRDLLAGDALDAAPGARESLTRWLANRTGTAPVPAGRLARLLRRPARPRR